MILIEDEHMERVCEWMKGSVQCTNTERSACVPAGCSSIYRQGSSESQPKFMPKCVSGRPTKSSSLLKRKLLQLDFIVKENNCPSRRARKRFSIVTATKYRKSRFKLSAPNLISLQSFMLSSMSTHNHRFLVIFEGRPREFCLIESAVESLQATADVHMKTND